VRGFFTLNEAFQLSPFRRGASFFTEGFYKGVAVVLYDWKEDGFVFNDTNITAGNERWHGGYGQFMRKVLSTGGDYTQKTVLYFDDATVGDADAKTLTFVDVGHTRDNQDDEVDIAEGTRFGHNENGPQVCRCDTGVTFDGGNMVDGDHVVQWKYVHDTSKGDSRWTNTIVLNVASNVLTLYASRIKTTAAYVSVEDTKDAANINFQFTWDPSDNTWVIDDGTETRFDGASVALIAPNNSDVSFTTSGGVVQQEISTIVAPTSSSDHRIWSIEIEEV